jgi:hypothetical protein
MSPHSLFVIVRIVTVLLPVAVFPATTAAQEYQRNGQDWESRQNEDRQNGQEDDEPGIRDNSFLVEEAFNQEQGIVQHVFNWVPSWQRGGGVRRNDFEFRFTQEWPLGSERHQFSYSLPMEYLYEKAPGEPAFEGQGFGDMMLDYRYQLLKGDQGGWWAAPRFSVILPTGDVGDRLGNDQVGYQVNLPFSREFKRMALHLNAGMTYMPGVTVGLDPEFVPLGGRDLRAYNLGASTMFYLGRYFHLVFDTVALWEEELQFDARRDHTFQWIINPAFRWAPYTEGDTQWVVGVGVPIGLTRDTPDVSLFLYMSFEHRVVKKRG